MSLSMKNSDNQAQLIVEICQRLHGRNMLAAADGNISYRVSDDEILITPSGIAVNPVISYDGKVLRRITTASDYTAMRVSPNQFLVSVFY